MIMKSRVTGKYVLEIFEQFSIDRLLPKYAKDAKQQKNQAQFGNSINFNTTPSFEDGDEEVTMPWVGVPTNSWSVKSQNGPLGWKHRLVIAIEKLLRIHKPKKEIPSGKTNPMQILLSVRGNLKEAQDYTNRLMLYDEVIQQAKVAGQIARVEQLMKARKIVKWESLLIAAGFKQYLSEDTTIEFAEKCQKGLRLDWVANFARPIPGDVIAKKVEADALMVFDNYVVMHYDPGQTAFALTKQQEEAKKDPILFGVIEGVRKLYFIGDWKDDECSLTMDEVAQVLGKPTSVISDDPTKE